MAHTDLGTRPAAPNATLPPGLAALERERVRWVLLRADATWRLERDVDVLVAASQLAAAENVLRAEGFVRIPVRSENRLYVAYDERRDHWDVFEVATVVRIGGQRVDGASLLARRRRSGEWWVMAPDDAFWHLLARRLGRGTPLVGAERTLLERLAPHVSGSSELARVVEGLCPPAWSAERLRAAVPAGDWGALAGVRLDGRAGAARRRRRLVVRAARRGQLLLRRNGVSVAFIGPDGAGKTTLCDAVARSFYLPARTFYMGLNVRHSEGRPAATRMSRRALPIRLRRQARRLARLGRTWLRARVEHARGRLVVFDRYTYDAEANWGAQRSRGSRGRRWLVRHVAPPPDVVVLLDVPAEVMFERKGEHSVELLEERRRRYLQLTLRHPEIVVLDGTLAPDELRRRTLSLLWRTYAAQRPARA